MPPALTIATNAHTWCRRLAPCTALLPLTSIPPTFAQVLTATDIPVSGQTFERHGRNSAREERVPHQDDRKF